MIGHIHLDPSAKSESKSKCGSTLASARLALFGEPLLLEHEDGVAYEDLLARILTTNTIGSVLRRISRTSFRTILQKPRRKNRRDLVATPAGSPLAFS